MADENDYKNKAQLAWKDFKSDCNKSPYRICLWANLSSRLWQSQTDPLFNNGPLFKFIVENNLISSSQFLRFHQTKSLYLIFFFKLEFGRKRNLNSLTLIYQEYPFLINSELNFFICFKFLFMYLTLYILLIDRSNILNYFQKG